MVANRKGFKPGMFVVANENWGSKASIMAAYPYALKPTLVLRVTETAASLQRYPGDTIGQDWGNIYLDAVSKPVIVIVEDE